MKRKNTKLYNIIFPVWIIAMFPPFIFVTLPLNFIIDRLVLVCTMKHLHTDNYRQIVKKCIWKVWGLGFLADFVGAVFYGMPISLNTYFLHSILNGRTGVSVTQSAIILSIIYGAFYGQPDASSSRQSVYTSSI